MRNLSAKPLQFLSPRLGTGVVLLLACLLAPVQGASVDSPPEGMVLVPEGPFAMGSPVSPDETPHTVRLAAFYIDRTEVSQKAFREAMGRNPSSFKGENLPVEQVTWYEARDYCKKTGKRLPTEAEWEKAARGGTDSTFYWGEEIDGAHAWYWDNSNRTTHPVGETAPNGYGLFDTAGNVWEWVADHYGDSYYETSPPENPAGPFSGKYRVIRGGSWRDFAEFLRVSRRNYDLPSGRFNHIGFRCAR